MTKEQIYKKWAALDEITKLEKKKQKAADINEADEIDKKINEQYRICNQCEGVSE